MSPDANGANESSPSLWRNATGGTSLRWTVVSLVVFLILVALIGLVVGAIARFLLPGPDPIGIGATIVVGWLGSFSAGLFSWYVLDRHGAGLLLSVVFAMLILFGLRRARHGG